MADSLIKCWSKKCTYKPLFLQQTGLKGIDFQRRHPAYKRTSQGYYIARKVFRIRSFFPLTATSPLRHLADPVFDLIITGWTDDAITHT
jgi:hypothetical protein